MTIGHRAPGDIKREAIVTPDRQITHRHRLTKELKYKFLFDAPCRKAAWLIEVAGRIAKATSEGQGVTVRAIVLRRCPIASGAILIAERTIDVGTVAASRQKYAIAWGRERACAGTGSIESTGNSIIISAGTGRTPNSACIMQGLKLRLCRQAPTRRTGEAIRPTCRGACPGSPV